jgi:hypothetical protein
MGWPATAHFSEVSFVNVSVPIESLLMFDLTTVHTFEFKFVFEFVTTCKTCRGQDLFHLLNEKKSPFLKKELVRTI